MCGSRLTLARICRPPAATPRDETYRYHANWTAERDSTKYHRMLAFAEVLPAIRKRTRRDLMGQAHCRPRVLATVVELLARTYIRIGNEEYTRANKSHGLTTLRDRHVTVRGRKLSFAFRGKSGVFQEIEIEEPRLALAVRQCQDLPGQTLFQYLDESKKARSLTSSDINSYLREVTGGKFTAKDFRTWAGTLSAAQALDAMEPPDSKTAANKLIVEAVDKVADVLGNTRSVCRALHPPGGAHRVHEWRHASTVTIISHGSGTADPEARPPPALIGFAGTDAIFFRSTHHRHAP
jgi:DNA topoisomerase-1